MKLKSYTLIEVTIAAIVFMLVAIMATVSFSMIRSSNEKSASLKNAGECREILQNYVESEVKNASKDKRIMGLKYASGNYTLKDLVASDEPTVAGRYIGVALFSNAPKYKVIYKMTDGTNYHYYYSEHSYPPTGLPPVDGTAISPGKNELLKGGTEIQCVASDDSEDLEPFSALSVNATTGGGKHSILIGLNDKIFTLYKDQKLPSPVKNFAYAQVEVVNQEVSL